ELSMAMMAHDIGPAWVRLGEATAAARAPIEAPTRALLAPAAAAMDPEPPWVAMTHTGRHQEQVRLYSLDGGVTAWTLDEDDDDACDEAVEALRLRMRQNAEGPWLTLRADKQVIFKTLRS